MKKQPRTILYTEEQQKAMREVYIAGVDLARARTDLEEATAYAREKVEEALLLGIHYKELKGLSQSFTYRVLKKIAA